MLLILRLEACAGDSIENAAREMVEVAKRVGVMVVVNGNGVELAAMPGDHPRTIVDAYKRAIALRFRATPDAPRADASGGR